MSVAVVTDSTAYLPEGLAEEHDIRVVPLHVLVDGVAATDGLELGPTELVEALQRHSVVTTSRPAPAQLAATYRAALETGADAVVAVHLSSELSGTWESAVLAAEEVGAERVRVVDARSAAMGLGFCAVHAARAAARGESAAAVERAAARAADEGEMFFVVHTLDYLRRGGRIGAASAALGTALAVKPVLRMTDGEIRQMEKVRTMQRAVARLVDLAADAAGHGGVEIAVHHLGTPDRAVQLATSVQQRIPHAGRCVISEVGAVVGAHTGPGVLGVVVQRLPE